MTKELYRDTHLEIDLDIIIHNFKKIQNYIGKDVKIAPVLKANAYGHGAIAIAGAVIEAGCEMIAVATLTEGIELRKVYKDIPILIMGHTPDHLLQHSVRYHLIQTIFTYEQGKLINDLYTTTPSSELTSDSTLKSTTDSLSTPASPIKVHIKYDTGFNRLGFKDSAESIQLIQKLIDLPHLDVEGIFSHLALKDNVSNELQYSKFITAIKQIESHGHHFKYKHLADSISGIDFPKYRMDMIRPGAILYGLKSYKRSDINLSQALAFKTRISHLKWLQKGECVSYDYTWEAKQPSLIATLPFGYADGFPRVFKNQPTVTIWGHKVPIIGVKCMDQCMADVTSIQDVVQVGDDVVIYGDGENNTNSIQQISELVGTNKNEIVARLSRRVPRVYMQQGQITSIRDDLID